jgi:hypothetical protein
MTKEKSRSEMVNELIGAGMDVFELAEMSDVNVKEIYISWHNATKSEKRSAES